MILDFSAILVLLTLVSGAVWALDAWLLAPRRRAAACADDPWWVEYARSFFPVFLLVLLLRSFLVEPFRIPSGSMMPTLVEGDFILVNKYEYGIRLPVLNRLVIGNETPARGDIIVFRYPEDPSVPFIKRVIGIPGDHVTYRNQTLYLNGSAVAQEPEGMVANAGGMLGLPALQLVEDLGTGPHRIYLDPVRPGQEADLVVGEGEYFVLGDNRDNSRDSRYWGLVPDRNLIGRAFFIWMNFSLKSGGIDWKRIGTILQ